MHVIIAVNVGDELSLDIALVNNQQPMNFLLETTCGHLPLTLAAKISLVSSEKADHLRKGHSHRFFPFRMHELLATFRLFASI